MLQFYKFMDYKKIFKYANDRKVTFYNLCAKKSLIKMEIQ